MKILNKENVYKADELTVKRQNITTWQLMERAGKAATEKIIELFPEKQHPISIFSGIGNNGGDGLVIARYLAERDYKVKLYVVKLGGQPTEDFDANYRRLKQIPEELEVHQLKNARKLPGFLKDERVIDAIFGIGLNRPAGGWLKNLIRHMNCASHKIAIDIPSGLYLDAIPKAEDDIFQADHTLTLQFPKLVFFLPPTGKYVGKMHLIDIGIDEQFKNEVEPQAVYLDDPEILPLYRPKKRFSHKGTYGHVLIAGGSYGKMGSVVLSSRAALKTGTGKVTAFIPECGYPIVQTGIPEAMTIVSGTTTLESQEVDLKLQCIGFGIGAGTSSDAEKTLVQLMEQADFPMLIDADGLNILSGHSALLKKLPENSILTPHPGELEGLIGKWTDDMDKLKRAQNLSKEHGIILVLKDAYTIIVNRGELYINSTGNAGMATAGSGDVLTGIISSLLAQGYTAINAAKLGVHLHGKAGDFAKEKLGEEAMIASDLINHLSAAFLSLQETDKINFIYNQL